MSIFLRKKYLQKPLMRSFQGAQRDLFTNAEKNGIDPGSIVLACPFWERGGTVFHNYAQPAVYSPIPLWEQKWTLDVGVVFVPSWAQNTIIDTKIDQGSQDNFSFFSLIRVDTGATTYGVIDTKRVAGWGSDYGFTIITRPGGGVLFKVGTSETYTDTNYLGDNYHAHKLFCEFSSSVKQDIYVDGVEVAYVAQVINGSCAASSDTIQLLSYHADGNLRFDGNIDIMVYAKSIMPRELLDDNPYVLFHPTTRKSFFFTDTQVATPEISPSSGEYPASQDITITCGTSGATIYYTEDGSTPDATDTEYTAPFTLGSAKTIKAIGIKSGLDDSEIASSTYTIGGEEQQLQLMVIIT